MKLYIVGAIHELPLRKYSANSHRIGITILKENLFAEETVASLYTKIKEYQDQEKNQISE